MKKSLFNLSLLAVCVLLLAGCSKPKPKWLPGETARQTWTLANGRPVNCSVSYYTKSGERAWIWCDASRGPVSYRITGGQESGEWRSMEKIRLSKDDKLEIIPDPRGIFGDARILPRGKYSVSFKVGTEEFSALTLVVD